MKIKGSDIHKSGYCAEEYYIDAKDFLDIIKSYYYCGSHKYDPSTLNGMHLSSNSLDREIIRKLELGYTKTISEKIAERVLNNFDLLFLMERM